MRNIQAQSYLTSCLRKSVSNFCYTVLCEYSEFIYVYDIVKL